MEPATRGIYSWPVSVVCGEDLEDLIIKVDGEIRVETSSLVSLVKRKLEHGDYGRWYVQKSVRHIHLI